MVEEMEMVEEVKKAQEVQEALLGVLVEWEEVAHQALMPTVLGMALVDVVAEMVEAEEMEGLEEMAGLDLTITQHGMDLVEQEVEMEVVVEMEEAMGEEEEDELVELVE